jgi:rhamnogalacturonan endolyase
MQRAQATRRRVGRIFAPFLCAISAATLFPGCHSSGSGHKDAAPPNEDTGAGGASGTETGGAGGTGETGGITGTGGLATMGGVPSSGGIAGAGGVTTTGDIASTGGLASTGGAPSSGGIATSGGATITGGIAGSGGGASLGGATQAGGITSSGGATISGGVTSSGGISSSGGVTGTGGTPSGHFQMENVDRGLLAVNVDGGVYVGWRMFGYEYDAMASNVSYNLYRDGKKLTNLADSTNYLDASGIAASSYTVTAVIEGIEGPQSPAATPWAQNYLSIPLSPPPAGQYASTYNANDGSPGDLDGDGQYDIVLKWDPIGGGDDSDTPSPTGNVYLDGYTLTGKRLWRIDLGRNIPAGPHYTQFSVYDFDGDGKAEVACKTAPGTRDGTGAYLSTGPAASDDDTAVYVDSAGTVLTGPEYLTVFDGATGKELATVDYPVPRGDVCTWGDCLGNRLERYNGGMAFVSDTGNGKAASGRPSIIHQRGYYTRLTVSAYNWRDGQLTKNWIFDSNAPGNATAAGEGCHSAEAGDTNDDGAQEIITGPLTIASDGTFQCTTGIGHGDAMHVGELVVGKGLSVFQVHEAAGGHDCHDAATCKIYFNVTNPGFEDGRGVADYVSPDDTTAATCSSGIGNVNCGTGTAVTHSAGTNFLIYWDADESRELLDGASITKVGGGTLLNATGCLGNNGTKNTPTLTADLLGDWREELVLRESSNTALRVYTTTNVTDRRIYTLMHDPTYRAQVAFEQSGYNQPPHLGFHVGAGMADPPKPDITVR